jgi:hypothetical protein
MALAAGHPAVQHAGASTFSRENTMKIVALCTMLALAIAGPSAFAQDKPYKEGSIWSVTFVRVKPGMFDTYIRDLGANRRPLMEQAKKEGLILQEKMLAGESAGREDFDLILMVEYKNWAAFDGLSDKFRALAQKIVGSEDKQTQMMVKRTDVREIVGTKHMQEISYK